MRKSFKLIVFISVSAILSLVLALFIAPLRSSFSEYSNVIKEKAISAVGVKLDGANNGIGAVNTNRTESTIEVGSIKSGSSVATSKSNNAGNSEVSAISYSLQAYAIKNQVISGTNGIGASTVSGVLANATKGISSNPIQGSLGLNATPSKSNTNINSPALIGFNTLTTDLTAATTVKQGASNGGISGPPPDDSLDGPPSLPIGDGTSLMLIMALVFVSFKAFRIKMA